MVPDSNRRSRFWRPLSWPLDEPPVVRSEGVEPSTGRSRRTLDPVCLPFHHERDGAAGGSRTHTPLRAHAPQAWESASFSTAATKRKEGESNPRACYGRTTSNRVPGCRRRTVLPSEESRGGIGYPRSRGSSGTLDSRRAALPPARRGRPRLLVRRGRATPLARRPAVALLVRPGGVEPPRPCGHMDLNHAWLPLHHGREEVPGTRVELATARRPGF